MSADTGQWTRDVTLHCGEAVCGHQFTLLTLPGGGMAITPFVAAMQATTCPRCGSKKLYWGPKP